MAVAVGNRWLGLWGGGCQPVILEGFLDSLSSGGAETLVDGECMLPRPG